MNQLIVEKMRVDKWLWAARFFKTRSLVKTAIEGGKIKIDGQRCKPSREIKIGTSVEIRQGWDEKTVLVTALCEQRRGAAQAQHLYQETPDSIARRERNAAQRSAAHSGHQPPVQRPTKKQRRQLHHFQNNDHNQ